MLSRIAWALPLIWFKLNLDSPFVGNLLEPEGHPPVSLESGICPMAMAMKGSRLKAAHTIEETRLKIEAGASKLAANPSAYKTPVQCKRLCTDELKYCTHVPATITDSVGPKVSVKSMKSLTKWNGVHMRCAVLLLCTY